MAGNLLLKKLRFRCKKVFFVFLFVFISVSSYAESFDGGKLFRFELDLIGYEAGLGVLNSDMGVHMLVEGPSVGFGVNLWQDFYLQLTAKSGEAFFSSFSGDYMIATSLFPLYLSLIYEINRNVYFYIAASKPQYTALYDMRYTSFSFGFRHNVFYFENFSLLYLGCEFQHINISQSSRENHITSLNLTIGLGSYKKNFGH